MWRWLLRLFGGAKPQAEPEPEPYRSISEIAGPLPKPPDEPAMLVIAEEPSAPIIQPEPLDETAEEAPEPVVEEPPSAVAPYPEPPPPLPEPEPEPEPEPPPPIPEPPPPPEGPQQQGPFAGLKVIVLDTETTGIQTYDRIITFAAMRMDGGQILPGVIHMIFDPRKDSHPDAFAIHGWDDWTTRFQDLFTDHAEGLHEWLSWADVLVMHNAEFDMRILQREFRKAGLPELEIPCMCTMEMARQRWPGQSARLDACLARFGLSRSGQRHGAFEDVVLTLNLLLALHGVGGRLWSDDPMPAPTNLKAPPPRPEGVLPRRAPKRRRPSG